MPQHIQKPQGNHETKYLVLRTKRNWQEQMDNTNSECARQLKLAGAKSVNVIVAGR